MTDIFYFAYGSNMSVKRITARVASAQVIDTACLHGHRLGFRKVGTDGSAKCDIQTTQHAQDMVFGVLFSLLADDKKILDGIEGLGRGYAQKLVPVLTNRGVNTEALTYYATDINIFLSPFHWYKEHVLAGAREHRLPPAYIRMIESVSTIPDPDPDRHTLEMSIYRSDEHLHYR